MRFIEKFGETYRSYPSIYWVVISLELIERGAYYGIMGYFSVHLMQNLGISGTVYGFIYAFLLLLLYFVPIISSSLARKFGYKTILTIAFIILIPAYFSMTFLTGAAAFILPVFAWGVGAGAFKPMVSATIAHVTEKEHRNSAYSIYYLSINWGSLIAMVLIGFLIPQAYAHLVFIIGAVLITVNLLITLFFYRNPVERNPDERIADSIKNMATVLKDRKFALLLLIYAGFFFVFSAMHTFIPVYYTGFGIKPVSWFEAPLMTAFNPLTIVMLGPFLSRFMDKYESLKLMIVGMFIFVAGLLIIGMIPIWYFMIIGFVVFSIGEFLTHPNFISYVSKIAPEQKVALYMGYAFLPSAAGNVFGSIFGGAMWDWLAVGNSQPYFFWAIYAAIGLFTIGNFLMYNKAFGKKSDDADRPRRTFWNSKFTIIGLYALIGIVIFAGISRGTLDYSLFNGDSDDDREIIYEESSVVISESGDLDEGNSVDFPVTMEEENIRFVNATITWMDEPDIRRIRNYENQPDTFTLTISAFNQTISNTGSNTHGSEGSVTASLELSDEDMLNNGTNQFVVTVTLDQCGIYTPGIGPGLIGLTDNSNSFDLSIEYTYLREIKE